MKKRSVLVNGNTYLVAVGGDVLAESGFENEAPETEFYPNTIVLVTPKRED